MIAWLIVPTLLTIQYLVTKARAAQALVLEVMVRRRALDTVSMVFKAIMPIMRRVRQPTGFTMTVNPTLGWDPKNLNRDTEGHLALTARWLIHPPAWAAERPVLILADISGM